MSGFKSFFVAAQKLEILNLKRHLTQYLTRLFLCLQKSFNAISNKQKEDHFYTCASVL